MFDLLKRRDQRRRWLNEELRQKVRQDLRDSLHRLMPGKKVLLFGSVTRPHAFHETSDIDIALINEPEEDSRYRLQVKLEEMLRRPVDLVLLCECRFRDKIEHEGELWTS
jgi:predicted nucleotidyltransferase